MRNRTLARGAVFLGVAGALLLMVSVGCKQKEEPTAPGYYTGPLTPKGKAGPTMGGKGQAGGKQNPGGSSMN